MTVQDEEPRETASLFSRLRNKQYGKMSLRQLAVVLSKYILMVYIPLALLAFISNRVTPDKTHAAILLSARAVTKYDFWAPPLAFLGSYPAWTLYFNARGLRTDYFFAATRRDFLHVLTSEQYQSIVLVGHGSYNSWLATDGVITNLDIQAQEGHFAKKTGEWFQLTCPTPDFSPIQLGQLVMTHERSYYYNGESAVSYDFVLDALFAFWRIKAETRERERHGPATAQASILLSRDGSRVTATSGP